MKTLPFILLASLFISTACKENVVSSPETSVCIEAKIEAMRIANKPSTQVKRFIKNGEYFWIFNNGTAFDLPEEMLNVNCDTVCRRCRCIISATCQSDFKLSDSTAVVIWKQ